MLETSQETRASTPAAAPGHVGGADAARDRRTEFLFHNVSRLSAVLTLVTLVGIIVSLIVGSWPSIQKFGIGFLWSSEWNAPADQFGALIPIYGTLVTSIIALIIQ